MFARQAVAPQLELSVAPKADSLGLVVDSASFVPYYEQIVERVRNLIKDGRLHEGEVFCSEGEVAEPSVSARCPSGRRFRNSARKAC